MHRRVRLFFFYSSVACKECPCYYGQPELTHRLILPILTGAEETRKLVAYEHIEHWPNVRTVPRREKCSCEREIALKCVRLETSVPSLLAAVYCAVSKGSKRSATSLDDGARSINTRMWSN